MIMSRRNRYERRAFAAVIAAILLLMGYSRVLGGLSKMAEAIEFDEGGNSGITE
jgi:hypothetical protein